MVQLCYSVMVPYYTHFVFHLYSLWSSLVKLFLTLCIIWDLLLAFAFAYTECVSFSPASWSLCRIPKPQPRPGELTWLHSCIYPLLQLAKLLLQYNTIYVRMSSMCSVIWLTVCYCSRVLSLPCHCCFAAVVAHFSTETTTIFIFSAHVGSSHP